MATYRVMVGEKEYQVEIEDIEAQPVRAVVNGRVVQVWVQERESSISPVPGQPVPPGARPMPAVLPPVAAATQLGRAAEREVRAPMPGSIVSVAVHPGDPVEVGQDLCVLDAMKMNNRIRAPRAGTVAEVHVSPGQQVQHGDPLVTLASDE
jgi:biotin carboxyl carrier protein